MIEIIPTIIAKDFQEIKDKTKKVEPYVDWVQLDVMDGRFVDNLTWNEPDDLKDFKTDLKLEAHLMVKNPENIINDWIESGVQRIIFHIESTNQSEQIIKKIKGAGLEVGLAINPETPIQVVDNFINQLDLVLIMTVYPGQGGQAFLRDTLAKIKDLRDKYKDVNIEVDGGINLEIAPKVIQAGANFLASGSAIFNNNDIEQTIKKLKSH
ncbi:MAG: ribulose-phosphate 3-epimerase [bacterium]